MIHLSKGEREGLPRKKGQVQSHGHQYQVEGDVLFLSAAPTGVHAINQAGRRREAGERQHKMDTVIDVCSLPLPLAYIRGSEAIMSVACFSVFFVPFLCRFRLCFSPFSLVSCIAHSSTEWPYLSSTFEVAGKQASRQAGRQAGRRAKQACLIASRCDLVL